MPAQQGNFGFFSLGLVPWWGGMLLQYQQDIVQVYYAHMLRRFIQSSDSQSSRSLLAWVRPLLLYQPLTRLMRGSKPTAAPHLSRLSLPARWWSVRRNFLDRRQHLVPLPVKCQLSCCLQPSLPHVHTALS